MIGVLPGEELRPAPEGPGYTTPQRTPARHQPPLPLNTSREGRTAAVLKPAMTPSAQPSKLDCKGDASDKDDRRCCRWQNVSTLGAATMRHVISTVIRKMLSSYFVLWEGVMLHLELV
ncbi:hypothetical protein J6590_072150 [Homalodisca vitripennis]|nr:hypothetical protein J6590_072150 [Homalodisca vitripennis]